MSATGQGGVTVITGKNHSTLIPVALASGEQLAFNHNTGRRAFSVVVTSSEGQVLTGADGLFVTQPTTNQVVIANTSLGLLTIYVSVRWEEPTPELDLVPVGSPKITIEQLPPPPQTCPEDFPFSAATNVYIGDLSLDSDAAIAAFAAGNYDAVQGNVYITSFAVTSLAPLSSLRVISQGVLVVNAPLLTTLNGLHNLRRVEAGAVPNSSYVEISGGFQPNLTDVSALKGLRYVEGFELFGAPSVTELDLSCCNLTPVYSPFTSNFKIKSNAGLVSIKGLSGVTDAGLVEITNNQNLTSTTDWLPNLARLGDDVSGTGILNVYTNPSLASLNNFLSLQKVGTNILPGGSGLVYIQNMPALTSLSFPSLNIVGADLWVYDCDSLTNLNGFNTLVYCKTIHVLENSSLVNVGGAGGGVGLSNVVGSTVTNLEIKDNTVLPTAAQATALKNIYVGTGFVGTFTISGNGPG